MQNISFNLPELLYAVISAIVGFIFWIIRRINTNEKQIAVVVNDIKNAAINRNTQNKQTEDSFKELKGEMHELKDDIKSLLIQNNVGR